MTACYRYLTREELNRLSDYLRDQGSRFLANYLDEDHEPANGICLQVPLREDDAFDVDDACYMLGVGY